MRRLRPCALWALLPVLAASLPLRAGETNLLAWAPEQPEGGWTRWAPRPALAPEFSVRIDGGDPRLGLQGGGREHVVGGWRRVVSIAPGQSYRFLADVQAVRVPSLRQQVVCQVRWRGPSLGEDVAPEYVRETLGPAASTRCEEVLTPPEGATSVEVTLFLQWAPKADLTFKGLSLTPAAAPAPRPVRVATVYWRPAGPSTPAANVVAFAKLLDRAAVQKPDLVLLSEAITSIGTGLSVPAAAQEPRGPAFQTLSEKAREHRIYVVYGAYERAGEIVYNSAFVIGRDGQLVGSYRKVQLPIGEVESGLSPGAAYTTFDLDFGRVGILICHDTAFDEPARILTLAGAEILLAPAWGGDMTQLRARAIDNGVWLVSAGYDVPSAVIDPSGEVRVQTWKGMGDGTAAQALDLSRRWRRPWVGDWRAAMEKQRRIEAYGPLLEDRP